MATSAIGWPPWLITLIPLDLKESWNFKCMSMYNCSRSRGIYMLSTKAAIQWGPAVRIRQSIWEIATQPVILWILLGGKPKWLPLNFGFNDVMRTAHIALVSIATTLWKKSPWYTCEPIHLDNVTVIAFVCNFLWQSNCAILQRCEHCRRCLRQKLQQCISEEDGLKTPAVSSCKVNTWNILKMDRHNSKHFLKFQAPLHCWRATCFL